MAECTTCSHLRRQLTEERQRRQALQTGLSQLVAFGEDQLDPASGNDKVRPMVKLARQLVTRVTFLLETARS